MLEMLVYPVSAVMRLWHWLLTSVFGADEVRAWVPCILLLVLTVRGIILPFAWQTHKTTRTNFLMRPHLTEVDERYGKSVDPEDLRAEEDARKQIQKDHGYNPFASCIPALIQIPMFLGLYRLLLWMAVPNAASGRRIGVLSDSEIETFRAAQFRGVPLPAYVSMNEEQFAFLGTSLDDVRALALPLILTAIVLTSTNMLITQLRSRSNLEWESAASRRIYRFIYLVIPIVALSLIFAGLTGLVPVALLMYWVINNLFTTVQNSMFWIVGVRRMPSSEIHREHQKKTHGDFKRERAEKKARKRAARRKRASVLLRPHTALRVRRELLDAKRERKLAKKTEKAEKKELKQRRKLVMREMQKQAAAERAATKAAAKAQAAGEEPAAKERPVFTVEGSTRWQPAPEPEPAPAPEPEPAED